MEIKINGWIFIRFISPPIFIPRLFTSPAKNSIFYRNFTPLFYPTILLILPPPTTSSEITRIYVRWELVARRARPSMTHDIIGSTLPSSVFNGPRAKFNFFGCNRSNLSDTSYYFSTKLYTGAFFSLSLSLFPPRSNCRDPDPGKKLLKFRFLSDLSPRKFNRILFRFERFTCDTSVQICDRAAG